MVPVIRFSVFVMLALTLPRPASLCEEGDKPLLLSPYLDKNQVKRARCLSKVDNDCLQDFVPESHTGFITVDKELGNHLFFWFFPHSTDENAPLLLWLNGGRTVSSMLSLFWEHGPMEVLENDYSVRWCKNKHKDNESGYIKRQYPWTNFFSMLYVDNPVGVGFSFSDSGEKGEKITEEGYTKHLNSFLKQFFKLFPEYKTREIYLGGQSFAGKYISALGYDIHKQIQNGRLDYNLTGIFLEAPYYDPETQNEAFYKNQYALGVIDNETLTEILMENKKFYSLLKTRNITYSFKAKFAHKIASIYSFHLHEKIVTTEMAGCYEVASLLNRTKMKIAAHAGDREFVGADGNWNYFKKFDLDAILVSVKSELATLMENYKVLIFNGDYDAAVSTTMIEAALMTTPWNLQGEYNDTEKSVWRRDGKIIGYYSLTDRFCRVLVLGAGHHILRDKPEISYIMLQQFIKDGCLSDITSDVADVMSYHLRALAMEVLIFIAVKCLL